MKGGAQQVYPVMGRPLCYLVNSRNTRGKTEEGLPIQHFVDLTDFGGNGSCTCGDFQCRVVANMKKPHELLTDGTLCHHLRSAHLFNLSFQIAIATET